MLDGENVVNVIEEDGGGGGSSGSGGSDGGFWFEDWLGDDGGPGGRGRLIFR